jgi:hypothetical protein
VAHVLRKAKYGKARSKMKTKNYAWAVNLASWFAVGMAVVQTILINIGLMHGRPFDPVVGGETILLAAIGVVTGVMARCLKQIEARLTKIENERVDNSN